MRNLTYLLTGTLLFTSIIVGCKKDKSPSSSNPTGNQNSNIENISNTEDHYALTDSGSTSITDVDTNENRHNLSIKKWGFQLNADNTVTALSYGTDIFTLQKAMKTSDEYPILISNNALTSNSISILKFIYKSEHEDILIGQMQTVTHPDVIQEIRDFINGVDEDDTLNSYTELENSEKVDFNISFYKASYTVEHSFSFFSSANVSFRNRNPQAYMMIADTAVGEERQVGVNIALVSNSNPSTIAYQEPLHLSFQQPYAALSTNSNTTGFIEGLNIEGLDPLTMNVATTTTDPISFSFSQTLSVNDQEKELQITVTSDMEPLYFETPVLNQLSRAFTNTLEVAEDILYSDTAQNTLITALTYRARLRNWVESKFFPENEASLMQRLGSRVGSLFSGSENTEEEYKQNAENVKSFSRDDIYTRGLPTGQVTQDNNPTSQQVDSENETGFIQWARSLFSGSENTEEEYKQNAENVKSFSRDDIYTRGLPTGQVTQDNNPTSQQVDSENETGFIQSISSFFSSENDTTEAVQEIDWNEVYQTSQRVDNEAGFIQWARSLFSGSENTEEEYKQNAENVKSFSRDDIYTRGLPTGQVTQDNTPTPPSIDRAEDQIQPLVSTSPQQALREFEERNAHAPSIPILRFVEEM